MHVYIYTHMYIGIYTYKYPHTHTYIYHIYIYTHYVTERGRQGAKVLPLCRRRSRELRGIHLSQARREPLLGLLSVQDTRLFGVSLFLSLYIYMYNVYIHVYMYRYISSMLTWMKVLNSTQDYTQHCLNTTPRSNFLQQACGSLRERIAEDYC